MFSWFERRLEPFPSNRNEAPPATFAAFCWHYVKDAAPWLAAMSVFAAAIAIGEAMLYALLGKLVDWLANADRATFLAEEGDRLVLIRQIAAGQRTRFDAQHIERRAALAQ